MKAVIRSQHSLDVDLAGYESADPADDGLWVRMIIGPSDGPGEESFDVLVCTPAWLARVVHEHGPQIGRHHLVVERWVADDVKDFLRSQVERLDEPTWHELALKIGRIGIWEFEDYTR